FFWGLFRRLANRELPRAGADMFACTREVATQLVRLEESHSSLIGLLYWIGFRRIEIPYTREARPVGTTGWSFRRKVGYLLDSLFSFTEIPIMFIAAVGLIGVVGSLVVGLTVIILSVASQIRVPGYAPLMLAIVFTAS